MLNTFNLGAALRTPHRALITFVWGIKLLSYIQGTTWSKLWSAFRDGGSATRVSSIIVEDVIFQRQLEEKEKEGNAKRGT